MRIPHARAAQASTTGPGRISRTRGGIVLAIAAITVLTGALTSNTATAVPTVDHITTVAPAVVVTSTELAAEAEVTLQARTAIVEFSAVKTAVMQERSLRAAVVKLAKAQLGDQYVRGAAGPSRFDCSGLVRYVMKNAVGTSLPHSSRAMWGKVKKIKRSQARPGDLVFFFRNGAHHVGIYIGGGRMVDARNPREDVRISPTNSGWWGRAYTGMGRIIPAV